MNFCLCLRFLAIKEHMNRDKKKWFSNPAFVPTEVGHFRQTKLPTLHGVAIHDATPDYASDVVKHGPTHFVPDPSILPKRSTKLSTTSDSSQKVKQPARTDESEGRSCSRIIVGFKIS